MTFVPNYGDQYRPTTQVEPDLPKQRYFKVFVQLKNGNGLAEDKCIFTVIPKDELRITTARGTLVIPFANVEYYEQGLVADE